MPFEGLTGWAIASLTHECRMRVIRVEVTEPTMKATGHGNVEARCDVTEAVPTSTSQVEERTSVTTPVRAKCFVELPSY